ncbi:MULTISPECIES: hypothetical protein [Bacillaceae]|nr:MULTISPECIES: hypothetical protein [Bacillaceae]
MIQLQGGVVPVNGKKRAGKPSESNNQKPLLMELASDYYFFFYSKLLK